ncbi:MAG: hypothetical protein B0D92_00690 [Spirochaeta sp. LUC14_002_19_P3]|nr:MAG: hypothetical protein B0D92_00690 [Spirochaeta sp. LUC14_002_19_P3]
MKKPKPIEFLFSCSSCSSIPAETGAEVAFVGRSNSGKSSVLNTLAGRKSPAKTSSIPGKTRHINFYAINGQSSRRLTDLPGYGYARVSAQEMERWKRELTRYITERQSLVGIIIVMDIRRPFTELDRQMLALCQAKPVHILLNKSDKLKNSRRTVAKTNAARALKLLHPDATIGIFSALKQEGMEELRRIISGWIGTE